VRHDKISILRTSHTLAQMGSIDGTVRRCINTSLELATIQSNGQMFDFARTTTNIAQTPTSSAAFLTVTYRSICDSFFAGTVTYGT
jgi:hypothetical protein